MKLQYSRSTHGGFTLIEILMTMIILSVALMGMVALTITITQSNRLSRDMTTATTLAQDKMEELREDGYSSVVSESKATLSSPYSDFKREVTVTADSPAADMKTITVKVFWDSDAHKVELKTILAQ